MRKLRESKWIYILFSVFIAAILWLYVGKEADPVKTQSFSNIAVTFTGVDQLESQGLTISKGTEQKISVRIQARNSILRELAQEGNIVVTASVSAITQPGEYELDYTITPKLSTVGGTLSSVEILGKSPSAITITVSRQTARNVEVRCKFTGSVADGFEIGQALIAPATIEISGTEEETSQVSYAQVVINESELSSTFIGDMPFVLYDYDNQPIENTGRITTDVSTVQVTLPVMKLKEVPLRVEVVPGGGATEDNATVNVEPRSIIVGGSQEALDAISEIVLGSIELSQVVDSEDYTFDIPLDSELTNVTGISQATVHVEITGLVTKTIDVTNIELLYKPDGYQIEPVTKSCQIYIRGTQEAVDAVLASQMRVVVDCSEISGTGTQTVPAEVYLDSNDQVGVVGSDYQVTISVSR